ncbi:MAG: translation elongation factor Ts [Candidatus Giovannonibacteria bacterium]|nr:MAG: translation elongation factor Ts [Candidatus Giovannonibacteria bacterium]
MTVSADSVKRLRELTGASVALCKKALEEAEGDTDKAIALLQKSSEAVALKKAERKTGAGVIDSYIHVNRRVGVLLELRCETDFVAKNAEFQALAHDLALHIAGMAPEDVIALMAQPYVKDPSTSIEELIKRAIGRFGEKIEVARFTRYEV